jgi:Taurine catabolism dioxygenase TauD, TfdA family
MSVTALASSSSPVLLSLSSESKTSDTFKRIDFHGESIKLDPSWFKVNVPAVLSVPHAHFIEAYEALSDQSLTLAEWGKAARATIDEALPRCGVLVLRNLNFVHSAADLTKFWEGCCSDTGNGSWEPAIYHGWGVDRDQEDGVDLPTKVPASVVFPCHSENAYSPRPPSKICLFCLKDAEEGKQNILYSVLQRDHDFIMLSATEQSISPGGESLIARSQDITDALSDDIKDFMRAHGGIRYVTRYHNAANDAEKVKLASARSTFGLSWQTKCAMESKEDVRRNFLRFGFEPQNVVFDEDDNLTVTFTTSGFMRDVYTDKQVWFNCVDFGTIDAADGTPFPKEMLDELRVDKWKVRGLQLFAVRNF